MEEERGAGKGGKRPRDVKQMKQEEQGGLGKQNGFVVPENFKVDGICVNLFIPDGQRNR
mgnify:CR=1 FL=1